MPCLFFCCFSSEGVLLPGLSPFFYALPFFFFSWKEGLGSCDEHFCCELHELKTTGLMSLREQSFGLFFFLRACLSLSRSFLFSFCSFFPCASTGSFHSGRTADCADKSDTFCDPFSSIRFLGSFLISGPLRK